MARTVQHTVVVSTTSMDAKLGDELVKWVFFR